jgi:hypothetical protein
LSALNDGAKARLYRAFNGVCAQRLLCMPQKLLINSIVVFMVISGLVGL